MNKNINLEQFKTIYSEGFFIDDVINKWLKVNPDILICDLKYHASRDITSAVIMYVQDAERVKQLPADLHFTEICGDTDLDNAAMYEDFEKKLCEWRAKNSERRLLNVWYDLHDDFASVLILHSARTMRRNDSLKEVK